MCALSATICTEWQYLSLLGGVEAFAGDCSPAIQERAQEHCRDNDECGRGPIVVNEMAQNHSEDDRGEPNDYPGLKFYWLLPSL